MGQKTVCRLKLLRMTTMNPHPKCRKMLRQTRNPNRPTRVNPMLNLVKLAPVAPLRPLPLSDPRVDLDADVLLLVGHQSRPQPSPSRPFPHKTWPCLLQLAGRFEGFVKSVEVHRHHERVRLGPERGGHVDNKMDPVRQRLENESKP